VASVGEPRRSDLAEGLSRSCTDAARPTPRSCSLQQRADEADDGSSVREDAHHIGAPADLLVQALLEGWCSRSGARAPLRKCGKASSSQRACSTCSPALRQLPSQRVNHSLELSLHLGGVRLVDDGAHQGCHARAACDPATLATRSRSSWVRHRCWVDPGNVSPIASTSPWWASQDHEYHPGRARVPPASASKRASRPHPRWWRTRRRGSLRFRSALTPVTTSTWTLTVLPASRTLTTRASAQTIGYGPLSGGRVRKAFTSASRLWAIVRDLGRRQLRDPKGPSQLLEASPRDPEHASRWRAAGEGYLASDDGALGASPGSRCLGGACRCQVRSCPPVYPRAVADTRCADWCARGSYGGRQRRRSHRPRHP